MSKKQPENPRTEALKAVVQSRLDAKSEDPGALSLREQMAEQNLEFADPDTILDDGDGEELDAGKAGLTKQEIEVDINSDSFHPAEEVKAKPADIVAEVDDDITTDDEDLEDTVAPEEDLEFYARDGKIYTKVKINGEEEEVEAHTLKASFQKDRASFARFEKAAEQEQENEQRASDLEAREIKLQADLARQIAAPEAVPVVGESVDTEKIVEELFDSMSYDDEDTVKEKISKFVSGQVKTHPAAGRDETVSTQRPPDVQAIVNAELDKRSAKKREATRKAALAQWEIDYDDVAGDSELRAIANTRSGQLIKKNPNMGLSEVMQKSGDFARKFAEPDTVDVDLGDTRAARKESIPAPVRTNSKTAKLDSDKQRVVTRSDTIAKIRQGRGQEAA